MAKRPTLPMPTDVVEALRVADVREDYDHRPLYQRNDYVAWIVRTKSVETRRGRIGQMIAELRAGGVYMGMRDAASAKTTRGDRSVSA